MTTQRRKTLDNSPQNACTLPDMRAIVATAETMRQDTRQFKVLGDWLLVRRDGNMLDLYSIAFVTTIDLEKE